MQTNEQQKTTNKCGAVSKAYNSLTEKAKATLLTYQKDYKIIVNGEYKVVAPLMYKTIMRLATLDGNANVTALRTNLHVLSQ